MITVDDKGYEWVSYGIPQEFAKELLENATDDLKQVFFINHPKNTEFIKSVIKQKPIDPFLTKI
jgi:hypothetical protein